MWQSESLTHRAVLQIPADPAYVQLARLVASGVAGRLDFNIDEIEDLRIGVDECCVAILECAEPEASIELVYSWDASEVLLQARVASSHPDHEPKVEGITGQILSAVVDKYRFGRSGRDVFFELRKRRAAIGS